MKLYTHDNIKILLIEPSIYLVIGNETAPNNGYSVFTSNPISTFEFPFVLSDINDLGLNKIQTAFIIGVENFFVVNGVEYGNHSMVELLTYFLKNVDVFALFKDDVDLALIPTEIMRKFREVDSLGDTLLNKTIWEFLNSDQSTAFFYAVHKYAMTPSSGLALIMK